jgi:hypothetical protein
MTRLHAEAPTVELFRALALRDPEGIGARYPDQVSDGHLAKGTAIVCHQREAEFTRQQTKLHPTAALGTATDPS